MVDAADAVEQGRAALRVGDAAAARAVLECVPPTPAVLEGLAAASYVLMEYPRASTSMERAYAAYRQSRRRTGAARMARTLAYLYGSTAGDWAIAGGWLARAKTILVDQPDSSERGWVALTEGMFEESRARKEQALPDRGRTWAGRRPTPTSSSATLSYLGASLVHDDRVEEGMAAARRGAGRGRRRRGRGLRHRRGDLLPDVLGVRATPTTSAGPSSGSGSARRSPSGAASRRCRAYCRTHYGGILTAAGRWPEADDALTEAVRLWALGRRTLKAGALDPARRPAGQAGTVRRGGRSCSTAMTDDRGEPAAGRPAPRARGEVRRPRDARACRCRRPIRAAAASSRCSRC